MLKEITILAGLAGYNVGVIEMCEAKGDIEGSVFIGGIAGVTWGGAISKCSHEGGVKGIQTVGGVAGNVNGNSSVTLCLHRGTVRSTGNYENAWCFTGGVLGSIGGSRNKIVCSYCYAIGDVFGTKSDVGIILGKLGNDTNSGYVFSDCYGSRKA